MYLKRTVNHNRSNILSAICSYHSENDMSVESSGRHKIRVFAQLGKNLPSQHRTVKERQANRQHQLEIIRRIALAQCTTWKSPVVNLNKR